MGLDLKHRVMRVQTVALCVIRKWWRPVMLLGVAVATWVNLVLIPLVKWEIPNMLEASAWVGACGVLSWVRHMDKTKGVSE